MTIRGGTSVDWSVLSPQSTVAQQIIDRFSDWAKNDSDTQSLYALRNAFPNIWAEVCEVGQIVNRDPMAVLAANCFYDLAACRRGCTAFAVDVLGGPLHAYCLDWDFGAEVLRKHMSLFIFSEHVGRPRFLSMGWPGFLGAFVGVAPGRFAISLNAVWSEDDRIGGEPVAFLLRRVLATVSSFDQAIEMLSEAQVASDCILLVSGPELNQVAVVERTPSRSAVRWPNRGTVIATNHYCALEVGSNRPGYTPGGPEPIGRGSNERYAAVADRLSTSRLDNMESCYSLLDSPPFCQPITLQRVVMRAATGQIVASPVPSDTGDCVEQYTAKLWTTNDQERVETEHG